jgi:hypothetical protein
VFTVFELTHTVEVMKFVWRLLQVVMAFAMADRLGGDVVLHKVVCPSADQTPTAEIISAAKVFAWRNSRRMGGAFPGYDAIVLLSSRVYRLVGDRSRTIPLIIL